ncbi:Abi-alpha family protein [Halorarius halobius]|uniref:Abi-alpha family protein n=1 Tax=Halorarius halobius TaxID=2962671 RepID=UPI0020CC107D|nr:Abi-alpha family protein [Halorarius halobius]
MSEESTNPGDDPGTEDSEEPTADRPDEGGDGPSDDDVEELAASLGGRTNGDGEFDPAEMDDVARDLTRRQVERLFDVLEAALSGPDRLDEESLDTLLSSLEAAIVDPTSVDSRELDRMLALWEAVLVDAASFDDAERALSVFEAAGLDERRDTGWLQLLDRLGLDGLLESTGTADAAAALSGDGDSVDPYRLARLLALVTRNATANSGETGVRVATELARAAATAHSPAELLDDGREVALTELERLGVDTGVDVEATRERRRTPEADEETKSLRERGEALLEQSADIDYTEEYHPAYDHVVEQLAPDEARILRLLATEGPEPAVDVRDVGWLPLGSTLLASHLTMLGQKAGCRHAERMPAYLHNLDRLGLLWFADEPVEDLDRYRVLEAQPHVENAEARATRPKKDRRKVHLTPFGVEFCREAFGIDPVPDAAGALGDVEPDD